jgi:oligoendopeptidase F
MDISNDPKIGKYKNAIIQEANSIRYLLEEKQEYVLNIKSKPLSVFGNLENEFRNSFTFPIKLKNKIKYLTEEDVRSMRSDKKEEIRKQAYESLRSVYNTKQNQICL